MKEKISTSKLLQRIFKTTSLDRLNRRFDTVDSAVPKFNEYISDLCKQKKLSHEQVIKKSDIARTYGHQLFNGTRKPARDRVIQLAFGFGMNYEETQKLLTIARKSTLYPKIKRDAIIIFALKHEFDINAIQTALYDALLPLLGEER
ncbi:MAG: helix-turn-helix transcriptional regulator [Oscillospiraceae bacterium]|jgi:transcriptional regulator with XRE-family HTH domain|nr:helix-turn-helix transcriptional regulator [Oscillospiraceae bacterium]